MCIRDSNSIWIR